MRNIIFLLIILSPVTVPAQWKSKIKTVDSALNYLYERQLFNGTVLIAEKGRVLYKKAFGVNGVEGRPLSTAAAFNLASVSKQFFTMMALMLKEEGKMDFDQPLQNYLSSFPYPAITIRQLMNHTSGLPEYFDLAAQKLTLIDTLDNNKALMLFARYRPALLFEPGEKFEYCNSNYILLATLIEKLSGKPCDVFFRERIVNPLHLSNTYIYNLTMKAYPASRVFGFHYEGGKRVLEDLTPLDGVVGDGNIYSSVEDLYTWDQALYTEKLVKRESFQEAITSGKLNNGASTYYGFGWFIDGKDSVSHSGGWVAFGTYIKRYLKSNQTLIFLSNSANGSGRNIVKAILEGLPYKLPETQLISNVSLIDGTGSAARKSNLRIVGKLITDIGDLSPFPNETVIDGKGNTLAPGFIDSHSHHEGGLQKNPEAIAAVSQGITSIVTGQDGGSDPIDSLQSRIMSRAIAVNIASYTGFGSLRDKAMKGETKRNATPAELDSMKKELLQEIGKGSLGLSTGLEYEWEFYSSRDEVIELAKAAAGGGGRYISHIRSEDVNLDQAIDEIIEIGRQARLPVQISHIKIAMRSKWGTAPSLLAKLEAARAEGIDITADCYPYTMWQSTPRVLFPKKDFQNRESAVFAVENLIDPAQSVITRFGGEKSFEGRTITEIGALHNESAADALLRIIRISEEKKEAASIVAVSMSEPDISDLLRWSHTNICSDGTDGGHPRGYGAFTRVLGKYVGQEKIMPLEMAVYKMTGLTAAHLGLKRRGLLTRFYYADLVLFNPLTAIDRSSIKDPSVLSAGIEMVWVNGQIVYRDQKPTKAYPGILIRSNQ